MLPYRPHFLRNREHEWLTHHFWRSLNQSIGLSLTSPGMFWPDSYYTFGTNRHHTVMPRDEAEDVREALEVARVAFLQSGLMPAMRSPSESELRSVLGRIGGFHGERLYGIPDLCSAVREAVKRGALVFVPSREDLRACVKAIQEVKQRHAAAAPAPQGDRLNPRAEAARMMGKTPRMPQNPVRPSWMTEPTPLSDAQSFAYMPDSIAGDLEQDAGVFLTPAEEADCEAGLHADLAECSAYAAMDKSYWWACHARSMQRYSNCLRGQGTLR
ncbi:hypothetical protein C7402_104268 [Paraburkholderia unamae]|uniref:Uncharacterized protein n=2 Tax=Paraburkholderia unamae TaxID=219649 RepID=A0ABX5KQT1_9BURK|nr:hypothetical protein C7402_104268 [Paraburkholderia unamae]